MNNKRIHTIAMFPKLQPDTISALYILKTFGEPFFPGIRHATVKFWTTPPNGQTPEKLEQDGYLLIDLGGLFDHHTVNEKAGEKKECLTTIVAKHLKVDGHPALRKLIKWAKRDDLEGKGTLSEDMLDRAFGLPGLIMNLNRLYPNDQNRSLDIVIPLIDAHAREEYKRNVELPRTWASLQSAGKAGIFTIKNGTTKGAYVETNDLAMAGFIRNREDAKIIITRNTTGHTNIITKQDSGLDLSPLIKVIRQKEAELKNQLINEVELTNQGRVSGAEEWYYDTAANTLQNGGAHPQGVNPTKISLKEIIELVLSTYP